MQDLTFPVVWKGERGGAGLSMRTDSSLQNPTRPLRTSSLWA